MTQENVGVPGRNNRERREPEKIDCPTDKSKMKEEKGGNLWQLEKVQADEDGYAYKLQQ